MERGFSIGEAFKFGYREWKKHWILWCAAMLFYIAFSLLSYAAQSVVPEEAWFAGFLLSLVNMILSTLISMGWFTLALKAAKMEPYSFSDFFSTMHLFPSYLWAEILFGLAFLGGLLLLVIPGFVFALKFCLAPFFVLDRSFKGVEALKASNHTTYGFKWDLLMLGMGSMLINLLGVLALGVGLFITMPLTAIAWAHVYTQLTNAGQQGETI